MNPLLSFFKFLKGGSGPSRVSISISLFLGCFCISLISGCRKDLTNSNETLPEHFSIVLPEGDMTLFRGLEGADSLKPMIKLPGQAATIFDTTAYTFTWTSLANGDTVSQKSYLTFQDFDGLAPVKNSVLLTVTEKKTGIVEHAVGSVFITTPTREGWLILGEKAGAAKLGMLSYTPQGYKKFIDIGTELGKNIPIAGKPVSVNAIGTDMPWGLSLLQWIGITTDQEVKLLQSMDFVVDQGASDFFTSTLEPSPTNPIIFQKNGSVSFMASKGGDVYYSSMFYFRYLGMNYADPINFYTTNEGKQMFRASKVHATSGPGRGSGEFHRVLYDEDSCAFVWAVDENQRGLPLTLPFSLKGYSLKAISTSMGNSGEEDLLLAFLHNETTKDSYLIQFLSNGIVKGVKHIPFTDAADILVSKFIEIDFNTGYIIYAKGNQVYAYDFVIGQAFSLLDFGSEAISLIRFQNFNAGFSKIPGRVAIYDELFKRLVVCTYNPATPDNSGTFRLYQIPLGHQAPIQETNETGFPKIVDASFIPLD